mmetsp:Transcript_11876/g.35063  ORF Transcript_11876/g.35063 Transcript_11876/m.35063 type:complete len:100 (-) Transcript_11876:62-361(-)
MQDLRPLDPQRSKCPRRCNQAAPLPDRAAQKSEKSSPQQRMRKGTAEVAITGGRIALSCGNKADDFFPPRRDAQRRRRVNHTEYKLDRSTPPPIVPPPP